MQLLALQVDDHKRFAKKKLQELGLELGSV